MLADTFIGKQLKALPADAQRASIVTLAEIESPKEIADRLERIKRTIGKAGNGQYLILVAKL
jgi:hypothetical protein